jgi:hypothetical protein
VAWTASGLYAANLIPNLDLSIATKWTLATNKIALYNSTDTPDFTVAAASAIYSATNEVSGTGWAAGGVALSAAAAGSTSVTPTVTQSPAKTVMYDWTNDVSVAGTTLVATVGAKLYIDSLSPKALILAMWFGGTAYTTSAGTFAITINVLGVATILCAA